MNHSMNLYWLELPANVPVVFEELPLLMASAMWPGDDDDTAQHRGFAWSQIETELTQAVRAGSLIVRNPLTLANHTFPMGHALKRAVVLLADLDAYLQQRGGFGLRVADGLTEPSSNVKPVQRSQSHQLRIIEALRVAGFDPLKLPRAASGRPSAAKQAAKRALSDLTVDQFKKAWQKCRGDGDIAEA